MIYKFTGLIRLTNQVQLLGMDGKIYYFRPKCTLKDTTLDFILGEMVTIDKGELKRYG